MTRLAIQGLALNDHKTQNHSELNQIGSNLMIFIQVFSAEGPISFSRLDAMKLSTSNKYRKMKVQRRNFLTKLSSFQSHTDADTDYL